MSSSPFACNKKDLFGTKAKKPEVAPPEPVMLVADKSQVVTAEIPFNTKQAGPIRQHMHSNILHNNQKIFVFRSIDGAAKGWTNIALDSTEASPKLTCDPITSLYTAWREFNICPNVSTVSIKWKNEETVLGYDDIAMMDGLFDPLPVPDGTNNDGAGSSGNKTDAEVIADKLVEQDEKLAKINQKLVKMTEDTLAIDSKMAYMVEGIGKLVRAQQDAEDDPSTTQSGGKRRARK